MVFGWSGMRGVVSLAAALSIPNFTNYDHPFPFRNLILIITFIVILVTLVFQGLTLPWVMKKLKVKDEKAVEKEKKQELVIRKAIAETSLNFLEQTHGEKQAGNEHVRNLSAKLRTEVNIFQQEFEVFTRGSKDSLVEFQNIYLALLNEQRKTLNELNHEDGYDEELIRKYHSLIDLEETKLREISV